MVTFDECITFARENPSCAFATMDGEQPRVRGMLMWIAEPEGFYFHTGAAKNLYRQLKANPRVEIYFHASGEGGGRMMRASGIAEFVSDLALRKRLFSERPFLRTLVKDETDPELILFRVVHGEAWFWTMRDNMREAQIPRVPF